MAMNEKKAEVRAQEMKDLVNDAVALQVELLGAAVRSGARCSNDGGLHQDRK
jgi:hypothetical protein